MAVLRMCFESIALLEEKKRANQRAELLSRVYQDARYAVFYAGQYHVADDELLELCYEKSEIISTYIKGRKIASARSSRKFATEIPADLPWEGSGRG